MSQDPPKNPKIIVDDDWKERVQAEKETLQHEDETPKSEPTGELPPASFAMLVSTLATQALAMMGQIPDPSGKPMVDLNHAKHVIDLLGILEEKTKGNLTTDEETMVTQMLHELRMVFVAVSSQPPPQPPDEQPPQGGFATS